MKRRSLIAMLMGTAAILPVAARAQRPPVPVVGLLSLIPRGDPTPDWLGFVQGLADYGFVEGQNLAVEWRWPEGHLERLPALAAELVARHVSVIVCASGGAPPLAAKNATSTIPIVFYEAGDPVRDGLVTSLKGPNGNITGVALLSQETTLKQVELLNELVAGKAPLGVLVDPTSANAPIDSLAPTLTARFDRPIVFAHAAKLDQFGAAFDAFGGQHVAGLVVVASPVLSNHLTELAALAASRGLPAIYPDVNLAASGGLMSYGASLPDMFHLLGNYVGKILKGARPEDLPVQQPTRIMLKINLKTAKSLGLTVPTSILVRADEVIE
jgi:putative ABC transport system substrate-binding protein